MSFQGKSKSENRPRRNVYCQCLMTILIFIRRAYDAVVDFIFSLIYNSTEIKKVPSPSNNLVKESASSLAEKIRKQEVSALPFEIFIIL